MKIIRKIISAIMGFFAKTAVFFGGIFNKDDASSNPAGRGTMNEARPRRRLVDGVDADRFTRLCVFMVIGFVSLLGAVLIAVSVRSGGQDVRRMLDSRGLVIVPALNPDGIEISVSGEPPAVLLCGGSLNPESLGRWKANARGVDINRNFDSGWDEMRLSALERGITGPSPEGWTGSFPESEPETRAIVALCEEKRFRHLIAFHSQGEVIYWNYRNYTPPIARLMAGILSMSSGYALGEPARSAGAAGMKDWFMEKYGKPAFTVEVGRGDCPIPLSGFPFLYRRLKEMLMLGIAM